MTASSVITTWPGAITVSVIAVCIAAVVLGLIYFTERYEKVDNGS